MGPARTCSGCVGRREAPFAMPGYSARPYELRDRAACLSLFDSNVPGYFSDGERDEFAAFLDELPGPYLVVEDEAHAVIACGGHAQAEDPARADLCWGMVRGDLHRKGIGAALTGARIQAAFADPAIRVIALNTSQHTVDFYRRMGFTLESVEREGYAPGLDRCEMRLKREETQV